MQWDRLSVLRDLVRDDIRAFGFFYSSIGSPSLSADRATPYGKRQTGYFRSNCMDCLGMNMFGIPQFPLHSIYRQDERGAGTAGQGGLAGSTDTTGHH